MFLKTLKIQGIKLFSTETIIPLINNLDHEHIPLVTFSGPNGSGKSTVVDALGIIQTAGLLRANNVDKEAKFGWIYIKELDRRLREISSGFPIRLSVEVADAAGRSGWITFAAEQRGNEDELSTNFFYDEGIAEELFNDWRGENPKNLIVTVPSTKYFNQDDVVFTRLHGDDASGLHIHGDVTPRTIKPLLLPPDVALQETYRNVLEDWFYERISPGRKLTVYNNVASLFLHYFFPSLSAANFSAQQKSSQITGLVRRNDSSKYDIRALSAGEKYIYLLFSFLSRYAGNILLLIFDEPENHLHESTLSNFYSWFRDVVSEGASFVDSVRRLRHGKFPSDAQVDALQRKIDSRPFANSVAFVTHSKLLIRRNISSGTNYLMHNRTVKPLHDKGLEQTLFEAGVSQIDERVLFVEGDFDHQLLESLLAHAQVEVRVLHGKASVCEAFAGFAKIDKHQRHPAYAFLLDRDSGGSSRYEQLAEKYPEKWEQHVVVLGKTEIENYLLEPGLFCAAMWSILDDEQKEVHAENCRVNVAENIIRKAADATRDVMKQKFISDALAEKRGEVFDTPRAKDIPLSEALYQKMIAGLFSDDRIRELRERAVETFSLADDKFGDAAWKHEWRSLCKGKMVFSEACREYLGIFAISGVQPKFLADRIKRRAGNEPPEELAQVMHKLAAILRISVQEKGNRKKPGSGRSSCTSKTLETTIGN